MQTSADNPRTDGSSVTLALPETAVADAMATKRRELISQPLERIWPDLARAAIAAMPAWQPIETAPKDGTPIIGAFWSIRWADSHRKGDIVRCWWQPEFDAFISSCRIMELHNGHKFDDGTTSQLHSPRKEPVTHWMPLVVPADVEAQP